VATDREGRVGAQVGLEEEEGEDGGPNNMPMMMGAAVLGDLAW
jgi:hypothetical protein